MGTISIDAVADRIDVTGEGFFDERTLAAHFAELRAVIARRRLSGLPIAVRVDLRRAAVQSQKTTLSIGRTTADIYRPTDRVAVIVGQGLRLMQTRRMHADQAFGVFTDEDEAERFLVRS